MEVVIEGNCYISGRLERCCIGIDGGKITAIAKDLEGEKVHSFDGKLVLPAAVDAHVHFRDPGFTQKEDFSTGSLSALCGGVTCVFDMPNTRPATVNLASLRDKKKIANSKSLVDFGLFAGVKPGTNVASLAKEAIGFKLYLGSTTGELLVPDIASIKKEISDIGASGKILAVHAEDEGMRNKDVEKNLDDHLRNRSNSLETSAIKKIVRNAGKGCKLHICHVSTRDSLSLVTGVPNLTSEVAPHHFLLDRSGNLGAFGKVNPPLRKREDRQAMFQALKEGAFDVIASDHAPHTIEEKEEDFDYAPSGVPGVETMVPLVMQHVKDKHLELSGAIRRLCERPAEIFGVRKGRIAVGYDADLMIFDMAKISIIKADALHSKCGWTPYEGMNAVFPKAVFLRGRLMVEDGSQVGERMGRDVLAGQV